MQLNSLPGVILDGKYRIEQQLGQGGMGAVFVATHLGTTRTVAVKVIVPQLAAQDEFLLRFQREAEAAGRLRHPNVVNVTDFGITTLDGNSLAYLVMEFLDGENLAAFIKRNPRPPAELILDIVDQVALGLDVAHQAGIVHRDLKPDNIWLESNRRGGYNIKVLDFGIAKLNNPAALGVVAPSVVTPMPVQTIVSAPESETLVMAAPAEDKVEDKTEAPTVISLPGSSQSGSSLRFTASTLKTTVGSVLGTPAFMAPEQCQGAVVEHQADIYSLAVISYQLFCGRLPFEGKSLRELLELQIKATPPAPRELDDSIPSGVSSAILVGLAKDPQARQPTAGTFASQFRAGSEGETSFLASGKIFANNYLNCFGSLYAVLLLGIMLPLQAALSFLASSLIHAKWVPAGVALVAFHTIGFFLLCFISQVYKAACTMVLEDASAVGYFRPNLSSNLGRLCRGLGPMLAMYCGTAFRLSRRSFLEAALWPAVWVSEGLSGKAARNRSWMLASTQPSATAALLARQYGIMLMATLASPTLVVAITGGFTEYPAIFLNGFMSRLVIIYPIILAAIFLGFAAAFDFLYRSACRCLGENVVWSLPSGNREKRRRSGPVRPATIAWFLPVALMIMMLVYNAIPREKKASDLIDAAVDGRRAAIVKALDAGAPVDSRDPRDRTPLIHAVLNGDIEGMRLLLSRGANVNARINNGASVLIVALANGRPEAASLLLERQADVKVVNSEGRSALIFAAMHGYAAICRQLLERGADPSQRDDSGKTALDYAKEEGFAEVVSLF